MSRRLGPLAAATALGLVAAGLIVYATWPAPADTRDWAGDYDPSPAAGPAPDAAYDLAARPPALIAPGTVVDRTAPAGWSHLVIKSLPRVRAGEEKAFPLLTRSETVRMASWMCTAFAADVAPDPATGRPRVRAVGLGLGTSVGGRDTIVTAPTADRFGVSLGLFGRELLTKAHDVQGKAVMPIAGPSLAVLDTPVWFRCGGENRLVRYRYALLAGPAAGRLGVLMWSLGADGGACGEPAEVVRVAPNTIDEAELVVDRRKVSGLGVPADDAFAVDRFPPGRRLPLPPDLRPLAARTRFTQDDARRLEDRLRALPAE